MKKKYIYLCGIKNHFYGFLYSKEEAEQFVKERGKEASFIKLKIKKNKRIKNILKNNNDSYNLINYSVFMRRDEYDYYSASMDQYTLDLLSRLSDMISVISLLKFSKNEQSYINTLCDWCQFMVDLINNHDYDSLFGDEDYDTEAILSEYKMMGWFVRNVLSYPIDEDYEFPF